MSRRRWALLVHQLPVKPIYLRAKIGRRLEETGAVPLKRSVYLLPLRAGALDALREIAREAEAGGGEAFVGEVSFEDGVDEVLQDRFRNARRADWERLAAELRELAASSPEPDLIQRLRREAARVAAIDFFGARGRRELERRIAELLRGARRAPKRKWGRAWTTRRGIQIDRIASAWFIRRFLEPSARFRFVDPAEPRRSGEIRFDMPEGDFTHEEDRCTFETLVLRTQNRDPAVRAIAEIVHELDLKDGKFDRPEAAGIGQLVLGIVRRRGSDEERLTAGLTLFDALYESFQTLAPAGLLRRER